jgi:hypothetical protein
VWQFRGTGRGQQATAEGQPKVHIYVALSTLLSPVVQQSDWLGSVGQPGSQLLQSTDFATQARRLDAACLAIVMSLQAVLVSVDVIFYACPTSKVIVGTRRQAQPLHSLEQTQTLIL